MKKMSLSKIKIFKIKNRKGYASICSNHLTEGKTPLEAYDRLIKAVKRTSGIILPDLDGQRVRKLVKIV